MSGKNLERCVHDANRRSHDGFRGGCRFFGNPRSASQISHSHATPKGSCKWSQTNKQTKIGTVCSQCKCEQDIASDNGYLGSTGGNIGICSWHFKLSLPFEERILMLAIHTSQTQWIGPHTCICGCVNLHHTPLTRSQTEPFAKRPRVLLFHFVVAGNTNAAVEAD